MRKKAPGLLDMDTLEEVTPTLRTLAHPLRLRILDILRRGERSVGEIADSLEKPQALTSHHLGIMRNSGVISARRDGPNVFYRVEKKASLSLLVCIRKVKRER